MPCCSKHAGQNVWPLLVISSPLQVGQVVVIVLILANVGWTFMSDNLACLTAWRRARMPILLQGGVKRLRPYCSKFRGGLLSGEVSLCERYMFFKDFLRRKVLVK
jgi:hypothetical protein